MPDENLPPHSTSPALTLIVPCYNEAAVLPQTTATLVRLLEQLELAGKVSTHSQVCFVDDGSTDATWALIERYAAQDKRVHGIKLSRNHGHQKALLAGLLTSTGDIVISIDADLQDDVSVIEKMVDEFQRGRHVVFGVRRDRSVDTWRKRVLAEGYYRLLRALGVDVIFNHADFRLLSRRALETLREYGEVNLFLRGIIPTIGFSSSIVGYERSERAAGTTKYTLRRMLSLALEGITSFSALPLRIIALLGILIFLGSLAASGWVVWVWLFSDAVVPGWASSVLPMYFLGGVQLLGIGIVGEYVAKVYMETKRRPRFIVEKVI